MKDQDVSEYAEIRVTSKSIMSISDGQHIMIIPLAEIQKVQLCFGLKSERPLMQAMFSSVLFIIGLAPLFVSLTRAARVSPKLMMIAGFIPFGIWGLKTSFAKGYYLNVLCTSGKTKLPLPTYFEPGLLRELIEKPASIHGFQYSDDGVAGFSA